MERRYYYYLNLRSTIFEISKYTPLFYFLVVLGSEAVNFQEQFLLFSFLLFLDIISNSKKKISCCSYILHYGTPKCPYYDHLKYNWSILAENCISLTNANWVLIRQIALITLIFQLKNVFWCNDAITMEYEGNIGCLTTKISISVQRIFTLYVTFLSVY